MKKLLLLITLSLLVACSSTTKKEEPKPVEPKKPIDQATIVNELANPEGILGIWVDANGKLFSIESTNELKERTEDLIISDLYESKFYAVDTTLLNSKLSSPLDKTKTLVYYHDHIIVLLSTTDQQDNSITKTINDTETIIEIKAASLQQYLNEYGQYFTGVVQINANSVQFLIYSESIRSEIANHQFTISLFEYDLRNDSTKLLDTQTLHSGGKGGMFFGLFQGRVQELLATSNKTYFNNSTVGNSISVVDQTARLFAEQDWLSTLFTKSSMFNIDGTLYAIQKNDNMFDFIKLDSSGNVVSQLSYMVDNQEVLGNANLVLNNGKLNALIPACNIDENSDRNSIKDCLIHIVELDFSASTTNVSSIAAFNGFFLNLSKIY